MTQSTHFSLEHLKQTLQAQGVRIWVEGEQLRFSAPPGAMNQALKSALTHHKARLVQELSQLSDQVKTVPLQAQPSARYAPFAMTDLQQAYWVGEHAGYAQSAVPCFVHHYHFSQLHAEDLQLALDKLLLRHEVLRTRMLGNGQQRISPPGELTCELEQLDFRGRTPYKVDGELQQICDQYPDRLPPLEAGPPLSATLVKRDSGASLILAIRLNVIDGPSLSMIFQDLLRFLFDKTAVAKSTELSYRDYVLALTKLDRTASQRYWAETLPKLASAPQLPVTGKSPLWSRFHRLSGQLDLQRWQGLKKIAAEMGVTANAMMLSLYASSLRPWARSSHFTLNVLANYRPFDHPQLAGLAGNCSNTTLLDCAPQACFQAQTRAIQDQLAERLQHASVSGVSLLRELQQIQGKSGRPAIPFVFTSGINSNAATRPIPHADKFRVQDSHLRTPQVWLDHQVIENQQGLIYYWDYVEDIFEPGVPEAIFEYFELALDNLLADPESWLRSDLVQPATLPPLAPSLIKNTSHNLLQPLLDVAPRQAARPALICQENRYSYGELINAAKKLAGALQHQGVTQGQLVAVQLDKSHQQVLCVLAISLAGAAWLPLDNQLPKARRENILQHSASDWLIQEGHSPSETPCLNIDTLCGQTARYQAVTVSPQDRAYVIYTSGSTGQAKGVVIQHQAVLNTLADINHRFSVSPSDRVLALSAFSFDLGVYDIWGTLLAGACIIMPDSSRHPEPIDILNLCQRHKVSIWNSVPALLDMTLTAARHHPHAALKTLRVIMLSGDWIPLSLAKQILDHYPQTDLYSLGGATEASIWSNYYPITQLDPLWRSIPYGFALGDQQLYVLDENRRLCPCWVEGEIYIAGVGLAAQYLNDPVKTTDSFIQHSQGVRLYATGDLGRYREDDAIEFLGRKDFQLKINGFRIEAGDIEHHLEQHPQVQQVQVLAVTIENNKKHLVACYLAEQAVEDQLSPWLKERVPAYMLPDHYLYFDRFPLSDNGKRDRNRLEQEVLARLSQYQSSANTPTALTHDLQPLAKLWQDITQQPACHPEDNFFQLGGNSLLAVQLVNSVMDEFGVSLKLSELFQDPSLAGIWARICELQVKV